LNPINTNKAIILNMASNLIDQLVDLLESEGIDIDPMDISIEGVHSGTIEPKQLAAQVREIAGDFAKIKVQTLVKDHRTDDNGSEI
jgi:hypothetical protein